MRFLPVRARRLLGPVRRLVGRPGLAPVSRVRGLRQIGWLESVKREEPVDAQGDPVPWFTYGAISFLDQVVPVSCNVLEIGGGNSSLWWRRRGNLVSVLEADTEWARQLRSRGMSDVMVLADVEDVLAHLENLEARQEGFGVVVVDGLEPRTTYLLAAARLVSEDGILVVDNSDRVAYREKLDELEGFHRFDFFGMGPQNSYAWATSVFSRSGLLPRGRQDGFVSAMKY